RIHYGEQAAIANNLEYDRARNPKLETQPDKPETRSPKSETRNPKRNRKVGRKTAQKEQKSKMKSAFCALLRLADFSIIIVPSDFGFRTSDFRLVRRSHISIAAEFLKGIFAFLVLSAAGAFGSACITQFLNNVAHGFGV